MRQDVVDEVLSGLPLYTIRDKNGNVLNDDVDIALKTPVTQQGTPINRAFLRNLQGDLYSQDRYSLTNITTEKVVGKFRSNPIPTTGWIEDTASLKYHVPSVTLNGDIVIQASSVREATYPVTNAFDGNDSTMWNSKAGTSDSTVTITFPQPIKILKFRAKVYYSNNWYFEASNDNSTFTTLFTGSGDDVFVTVEVNPSTTYKYYRIRGYGGGSSSYWYIYGFEIKEWYGEGEGKVHNLDIPLTSYEKDKIIRIKPPTSSASYPYPFININGLGVKQIDGELISTYNYGLLYNGTSFDIVDKPFIKTWMLYKTSQQTFTVSNINKKVRAGDTFDIIVFGGGNPNASIVVSLNGTTLLSGRMDEEDYRWVRCIVGGDNTLYAFSMRSDATELMGFAQIKNFTQISSLKGSMSSTNNYYIYPGFGFQLLTKGGE